jgi:hypothetical protein
MVHLSRSGQWVLRYIREMVISENLAGPGRKKVGTRRGSTNATKGGMHEQAVLAYVRCRSSDCGW